MDEPTVQFDDLKGFDVGADGPAEVATDTADFVAPIALDAPVAPSVANGPDPSLTLDNAADLPELSFFDGWDLWQDAVYSSGLAGVLLGWLGVYVVLGRSSFVSAAVSNLSSFGVVLSVLLLDLHTHEARDVSLARGLGIALGTLGVGIFGLGDRGDRHLPNDAVLAAAVILSSAGTLVCGTWLTTDYQFVRDLLYGDAVVASRGETYIMLGVTLTILAVHLLWRHRFVAVLFDAETAAAQGLSVHGWTRILALTVGVSVAVATTGLGALTAFAFVVLPASIALQTTSRLEHTLVVSALLGLVGAWGGYYAAFRFGLPAGATMVAILGGMYVLVSIRPSR